MYRGYVKLWRKIDENPISKKPAYLSVWLYIIRTANHKDTEIIWNNTKTIIKRGSFITSADKIAINTGVPRGTVERILKYLKNEDMIEEQTTHKFRLISVIKYNEFQSNEEQNEEQVRNKRGTTEEQVDTNNNDNNDNNEKENMFSKRKIKIKKTMEDLMGKEILLGEAPKTGTPSALDIKLEKKHSGSDFGRMCIYLGYFFNECYRKRFSEDYKNGTFSVSGVSKNISKYKEYSRDDWKNIIEFYFRSKKSQELVVTLEACLSENTIMEYKQKTKKPKYYND